jgi:aarF domain-containing kinase
LLFFLLSVVFCVLQNEVARAIELREIVTSLGPAYIKLGQALSIRPDILSPAAMTELQKLCDKVPSFPDDVAMDLIKVELGRPWQEIYSELSPSPIAAGKTHFILKLLGNFCIPLHNLTMLCNAFQSQDCFA